MYSRHISTLLGWLVGAMGMLSLLLIPPVQAQLQMDSTCPFIYGGGPSHGTAPIAIQMHEEPMRPSHAQSVRPPASSRCTTSTENSLTASRTGWNRALSNRDLWFARDKALHLSYSFLWTLSSQYVLTHKTALSHNDSLPWALTSGFTVGLAKELYDDRRPQNAFSWRDMTANAVGIGLAAALIVL